MPLVPLATTPFGTSSLPVWLIQAQEKFNLQHGLQDRNSSNSNAEEEENDKPLGPIDPNRCTVSGGRICGGTARVATTFVVVTRDSDGRRITEGGAQLKVIIRPVPRGGFGPFGYAGTDREAIVKDENDGFYTVTYVVPAEGGYSVHVECNGIPIHGSPFGVCFSAVGAPRRWPNYSGGGAASGLRFPAHTGCSNGVIMAGVGATLGEMCQDYLYGRCLKTACRLQHPPRSLLEAAVAATTSLQRLNEAPTGPCGAASAASKALEALAAAEALEALAAKIQAHQQAQGDPDSPGKAERRTYDDALEKTLQVSNLSPMVTELQLKQFFSHCGTVIDCSIMDTHCAFVEFSSRGQASLALALDNMDVGGRPLKVEMAESLPHKKPANLNTTMNRSSQQPVAMQQTTNSQQAATSARAAEISKQLKAYGVKAEPEEVWKSCSSPSKSRSRSPARYCRRRRSRSISPLPRHARDHTFRSPSRSRNHSEYRYGRSRRSRSISPLPRHERDRRFWSLSRSRNHTETIIGDGGSVI